MVEVVAYLEGDDFLIASYSCIVSALPSGNFLLVYETGLVCPVGGGGGGGDEGGRAVLENFGTASPYVGVAIFLLFLLF